MTCGRERNNMAERKTLKHTHACICTEKHTSISQTKVKD